MVRATHRLIIACGAVCLIACSSSPEPQPKAAPKLISDPLLEAMVAALPLTYPLYAKSSVSDLRELLNATAEQPALEELRAALDKITKKSPREALLSGAFVLARTDWPGLNAAAPLLVAMAGAPHDKPWRATSMGLCPAAADLPTGFHNRILIPATDPAALAAAIDSHLNSLPWPREGEVRWAPPNPVWSVQPDAGFVTVDVFLPNRGDKEPPAATTLDQLKKQRSTTTRFCDRATPACVAFFDAESKLTVHGRMDPFAGFATTLGAIQAHEAVSSAPPDMAVMMQAAACQLVLEGAAIIDQASLEIEAMTLGLKGSPPHGRSFELTATLTELGNRVWGAPSAHNVTLPGMSQEAPWAVAELALDLDAMLAAAHIPRWIAGAVGKEGGYDGIVRHYTNAGIIAHGAAATAPVGLIKGLLAIRSRGPMPSPTAVRVQLSSGEAPVEGAEVLASMRGGLVASFGAAADLSAYNESLAQVCERDSAQPRCVFDVLEQKTRKLLRVALGPSLEQTFLSGAQPHTVTPGLRVNLKPLEGEQANLMKAITARTTVPVDLEVIAGDHQIRARLSFDGPPATTLAPVEAVAPTPIDATFAPCMFELQTAGATLLEGFVSMPPDMRLVHVRNWVGRQHETRKCAAQHPELAPVLAERHEALEDQRTRLLGASAVTMAESSADLKPLTERAPLQFTAQQAWVGDRVFPEPLNQLGPQELTALLGAASDPVQLMPDANTNADRVQQIMAMVVRAGHTKIKLLVRAPPDETADSRRLASALAEHGLTYHWALPLIDGWSVINIYNPPQYDEPPDRPPLNLTLTLDRGVVGIAGSGGKLRDIPAAPDGGFDRGAVTQLLIEIKDAFPDERRIYLVPSDETPFQQVVHLMDAARRIKDQYGEYRVLFDEVVWASLATLGGGGFDAIVTPGQSGGGLGGGIEDALGGLDEAKRQRDAGEVRVTLDVSASGMEDAMADRLIRRRLRSLRDCYERELKASPDVAAEVEISIELTVNRKGRVKKTVVATDASGPINLVERVATCAENRMGRWRFPKPKGGSAKINVGLGFQPTR